MDWFERLTGFRETDPASTRERLAVEGATLVSRVNGARYGIGTLAVPSLAELRARTAALPHAPAGPADPPPRARTPVRIVQGDVRQLHLDPAWAGAVFQVASQFNLLEMTGPSVTPEDGVTRYAHDHTQGPACAIAAGAATIYRNYFAPVAGGQGQTATRQIDTLADVGTALARMLGRPVESLWEMRNGYALCSAEGLAAIDRLLAELASHGDAALDALRQRLRIGLHAGVEVTDGDERPGPIVSQVFCSALPVAYSALPAPQWARFTTLVLEAAYEATMLAAALQPAVGGRRTVLLTHLGGGAFGNHSDWIDRAIRRALSLPAAWGLDVVLVSYGAPSVSMKALVAWSEAAEPATSTPGATAAGPTFACTPASTAGSTPAQPQPAPTSTPLAPGPGTPESTLAWARHAAAQGRLKLRWHPRLEAPPPAIDPGIDLADKVAGMLLGLAIGDALGNTSESMTPRERRQIHGWIDHYLPNRHAGHRRVGLPSDDTQMAFWTVEHLLERWPAGGGRARPDLEALKQVFATREIYGMGKVVRAFRENARLGAAWHEAGHPGSGNGALMRIAPAVLPHLRAPSAELWGDTLALAHLTHDDELSNVSCVAMVEALWRAIGTPPTGRHPPARLPRGTWIEPWLATEADVGRGTEYEPRRGHPPGFKGTVAQLVRQHVEPALDEQLHVASACDTWHSGAYLLETVPSVLYILERHAHDPRQAILEAVNHTRDNDTVAAIFGAVVGALHGRSGLPGAWVGDLLGRTAASDDGSVFALVHKASTIFCAPPR
jgi:ADP-ribosylglycohydrolase